MTLTLAATIASLSKMGDTNMSASWENYVRHHLDYVDKPGFSADFSLIVVKRKEWYTVDWSQNGKHGMTHWFSSYAEARDFYEKKVSAA